MSKTLAWSWSRLDCFEQCARKFQGTYVTRDFPKPDFQAQHFAKGQAAHFLMEEHFKTGCDLKQTIYKVMGDNGKNFYSIKGGSSVVQSFEFDFRFLNDFSATVNKATQIIPELQVTYGVRMNELSWFNKKAWVRGAFDLIVIVDDFALIIDWKTGKQKKYSDQLRLFAGLAMTKYPNVKRVLTAYIWLDHPSAPPTWAEFSKADQEDIWMEFGDRSELIQLANESGNWPAKKNMFCKWCDALPNQCEFKPD